MFIEEKGYSKPQFELVIIQSVDIILASEGNDNSVGIEELLGYKV